MDWNQRHNRHLVREIHRSQSAYETNWNLRPRSTAINGFQDCCPNADCISNIDISEKYWMSVPQWFRLKG